MRIIKNTPALIMVGILFLQIPALASNASHTDALRELNQVWNEYNDAVNSRDGIRAYEVLSQESKDYWDSIRSAALSYSEEQVKSTGMMTRLHILMTRASYSAGALLQYSGREIFTDYINNGSAIGDTADLIAADRVYFEGTKAIMKISGDAETEHFLELVKEGSDWHLDFKSIFNKLSEDTEALMLAYDKNTDKLVTQVVEKSTGKPWNPVLWKPVIAATNEHGNQTPDLVSEYPRCKYHEPIGVVVLSKDVSAGEIVAVEHLSMRSYEKNKVHSLAIFPAQAGEIVGMKYTVSLQSGDFLMKALLSE